MASPVIWYGNDAKLLPSGNLLKADGSIIGGGGNSFGIVQTPSGTSPTAHTGNDTLTLTSSDSSITITGNSATDTIDFKAVGNVTGAASSTNRDIAIFSGTTGKALSDSAAQVDASGNLLSAGNGTVANPAHSFANHPNYGVYLATGSGTTPALMFSVNGSIVMTFDLNTGNGTPFASTSNQMTGPDGSASRPSFGFTNNGGLGVYRSASNVMSFSAGNSDIALIGSFGISISKIGAGLKVAEGANAKMGTAVLSGGVATVSTTAVTAISRVYITSQVDGGTPGWLRVSARTAGTSFTITSSSGTDTSTVAWMIVEPA